MGTFRIDVEVSAPTDPPAFVPVGSMLVDSGSELTWVREGFLVKIGINVRKADQRFIMADGQTVSRDVGYALLKYGEFETIDEVVFGREGDLQLLGARTLEGFNAVVDATRRRLVAAGPIPAASASGISLGRRSRPSDFWGLTGAEPPSE